MAPRGVSVPFAAGHVTRSAGARRGPPQNARTPRVALATRGAPTASCLLLAGRSPGPAGLSDETQFGPSGRELHLLSRDWTFVRSERDGALREDDDVAPDAHALAL